MTGLNVLNDEISERGNNPIPQPKATGMKQPRRKHKYPTDTEVGMRTLHLTLKKKWFDMIRSGEKKEEYREIKEYWENRLYEFDIVSRNSRTFYKKPVGFQDFDRVEFRNGYGKNAPVLTVACLGISTDLGKPEWGAEQNQLYFVLKLGEIIP